jgi:AcrR family transcriptional regulator
MPEHKKTAEKKNEILRCFCTVIENEGFENASIHKIAAQAKISSSLLIFYFKSKEELVINLVDFLLKQYEVAFFADIQNIVLPAQRFDKVINILFGSRWLEIGKPKVFYTCYCLAARNENIRSRFKAMYDRFKFVLMQEIDIWVKNNLTKVNNIEETAEFLIMLNEGLNFYQHIFDLENYLQRAEMVKKQALHFLRQA